MKTWQDSERLQAFNDFMDEVHKTAASHGWWDSDRDIPEILLNINGEVAELFESYRRGTMNSQCDKEIQLTCLEEELSDIIIRVLDFAAFNKIDIARALHIKNEYNKSRQYRHGNLKA